MVFGEDVAGHFLKVFGGESVYVTHDVVEVAFLTLMQKGLGEVKGELLTTVAGDGQLSLQLLFGLA